MNLIYGQSDFQSSTSGIDVSIRNRLNRSKLSIFSSKIFCLIPDFQLLRFIGSGSFGKVNTTFVFYSSLLLQVYVVLHKGLKKEYALKVMCKRRICRRKFAGNVLRFADSDLLHIKFHLKMLLFSELDLLQGLSHPFISSLWYAFQASSV